MPKLLYQHTTADLLAELYARFDTVVFAGLSTPGADEVADYGYCGSTFAGEALARGLAQYLTAQRATVDDAQPDADDDAGETN
jgi:hypothetical protein